MQKHAIQVKNVPVTIAIKAYSQNLVPNKRSNMPLKPVYISPSGKNDCKRSMGDPRLRPLLLYK
jgi:hypothetical protein